MSTSVVIAESSKLNSSNTSQLSDLHLILQKICELHSCLYNLVTFVCLYFARSVPFASKCTKKSLL